MLKQLLLDTDGTAIVRFSPMLAGAVAAGLLLPQAAQAQPGGLEQVLAHGRFAFDYVIQLLVAGYQQAPALVLVLGALLVVPGMVIAALLLHGLVRLFTWRRPRPAPRVLPDIDWTRDSTPSPDVPSWPADAWLTMEGHEESKLPIEAEVLSIGRHEDNVLSIDDLSVHRFHAVIHRTDDAQFIITDLSGEEGNGVRINGERQARAPLSNGDLIELGRARLTFAAVPH